MFCCFVVTNNGKQLLMNYKYKSSFITVITFKQLWKLWNYENGTNYIYNKNREKY